MRTLALVTARGGSKGIKRKNVREIAGKPLIAWTIEAALACPGLNAVVVSTDDPEIADCARAAGAEAPFLRPAKLAEDQTPGIDPVLHALEMLPGYDAVLLLQPTSPLRTTDDIAGILKMAMQSDAPAIVSVCKASQQPAWMYSLAHDGTMQPLFPQHAAARRQDLEQSFCLNGAMSFAKAEWLCQTRSFISAGTLGYQMPVERSIDIDEPFDWKVAEFLLSDAAAA